MSWAFNQIDVFLSTVDVDYENNQPTQWINVSDYGLVRSRPTITSSAFSGSSINVPGKNGLDYGVFDKRGNAKIEFEILVAYDWPHEFLRRQEYNLTVWDRIDLLQSYLNITKAFSYKEPGLGLNHFYKVKRLTTTINDAYEEAATIKVSAEVSPYRYDFDGWRPIQLQNGSVIRNTYPGQPMSPTIFFQGSGVFTVARVLLTDSDPEILEVNELYSYYDGNETIIVESDTMLAYFASNLENANHYLDGNYDILRLNGGYTNEALVIGYEQVTNVGIAKKDGIVI